MFYCTDRPLSRFLIPVVLHFISRMLSSIVRFVNMARALAALAVPDDVMDRLDDPSACAVCGTEAELKLSRCSRCFEISFC